MKIHYYIIIALLTIGCGNSDKKDSEVESDRNESVSHKEKDSKQNSKEIDSANYYGKAIDILKLKEPLLQKEFFRELDSIKDLQYPENDQEECNNVDITSELLNTFLGDINTSTFQEKGEFECFYNFNIACPGFSDSEICKDKISIQFFESSCNFRMVIENCYMVEGSCIGGAQVVYTFKIIDGKVINFGRNEAG